MAAARGGFLALRDRFDRHSWAALACVVAAALLSGLSMTCRGWSVGTLRSGLTRTEFNLGLFDASSRTHGSAGDVYERVEDLPAMGNGVYVVLVPMMFSSIFLTVASLTGTFVYARRGSSVDAFSQAMLALATVMLVVAWAYYAARPFNESFDNHRAVEYRLGPLFYLTVLASVFSGAGWLLAGGCTSRETGDKDDAAAAAAATGRSMPLLAGGAGHVQG